MAKRNQVTTELRISADAQLKNSKSFIREIEKIANGLDINTKLYGQLNKATEQLKNYNKTLEKVKEKRLITEDEIKNLIKAGKEIENLISKTEKLYSGFSAKELKSFSKEYVKQVKEQEAAIAKIKAEYTRKTGNDLEKDLAGLDKYEDKIKNLNKTIKNLNSSKNDKIAKAIEAENASLQKQFEILQRVKKAENEIKENKKQTTNRYSQETGFTAEELQSKTIKTDRKTVIKDIANQEYQKMVSTYNQISQEYEEILKSGKSEKSIQNELVNLAKKYSIENVKTTEEFKEQFNILTKQKNFYRSLTNRERLATEKAITDEIIRRNKLLEVQVKLNENLINDDKDILANNNFNSIKDLANQKKIAKETLSASNVQITATGASLTEEGEDSIAIEIANSTKEQTVKLTTELNNIQNVVEQIKEFAGKLATQSERDKKVKDFESIATAVDEVDDNVNGYTTKDNDRIANDIIRLGVGNSAPYGNEINEKIDEMVGLSNLKDEESQEIYLQNDLFKKYNSQIEEEMNALKAGNGNIEALNTACKNLAEIFEYLDDKMQQYFSDWYTNLDKLPEDTKEQKEKKKNEFKLYEFQRDKWNGYSRGVRNYTDNLGNVINKKSPENNNLITHVKEANKLNENLQKAAEHSRFLGSSFDDLKNKVGYFLSMNYVFDQVTRKISEASQYIKEVDKDMTQIGLVLGKTASQTWKNFDTYSRMANRLSTTTSDVTAAMKLFYQQGLNTVEVNKMVEASAIAAALGESTMAEASETLTSIVNSYNLAASQAIEVTDKISQVAIISAADFGEMSTAIEKVASSAASVGLDLDHLMGYLGKMIETTREAPTNIGTALKTIVANFAQFKEDPNATTEDGTDVNKVDKALKSVGIQLLNTNGEMRDLGEVIDELGLKWKSLSRNTKSYLATMIAGTRQQSRFYALMNDYDRTLELVNESSKSSGKATEQFAIYQDSLTASTQRLNNEWEKFYKATLDGDGFLKGLNNTLTSLLKTVNRIGPAWSTAFGIGGMKIVKDAINLVSSLNNNLKRIRENNLSLETITSNVGKRGTQANILQEQNYSLIPGINTIGQKVAQGVGKFKGVPELIKDYETLIAVQKNLEKQQGILSEQDKLLIEGLTNKQLATKINTAATNEEATAAIGDAVATTGEKIAKDGATASTWGLYFAQVALTMGVALLGVAISAVVAGIMSWVNRSNELEKTSKEALKTQQEEVNTLKDLKSTYDELNEQVGLSADEHQQLLDVIAELGEKYPDIVEQYDAEGNAIKINNELLEEQLRLEKELLAIKASTALEKTLNNKDKSLTSYNGTNFWGLAGYSSFGNLAGYLRKSTADNALGDYSSAAFQSQQSDIEGLIEKGKQFDLKGLKNASSNFGSGNMLDILQNYAGKYITEEDAITRVNQNREKAKNSIKEKDEKLRAAIEEQLDAYYDSAISFIKKSNSSVETANKKDLLTQINDVISGEVGSSNLNTQQQTIATNAIHSLVDSYYDKLDDSAFAYYASEEVNKDINTIIEEMKSITDKDTLNDFDSLINDLNSDKITINDAYKRFNLLKDNISIGMQNYLIREITEYDDYVQELIDTGLVEDSKKQEISNLSRNVIDNLNDSYNTYIKDLSDETDKNNFKSGLRNLTSNTDFLEELNTLDTNDFIEVRTFKQKYSQMLGEYGEDFFDALLENPAYDAEKIAETMTASLSIANGTGTTASGASMSDIASGESNEAAMSILSSDDESRAQNLLLIGQEVKVSAEEISDSYRQAYEDVVNSTEQIIAQAEGKLETHVNTIRDTLNNQNWNIGDEIDYNGLSNGEKEIVKNSEKAISNLKKQINYAEELQKRYKVLTIEQQANVDYAPFRNGAIAANEMINSLSNLADIYDVVTNKEYTQLDLINWIANDTSGQLLAALEVENGQLALNANSMEYLAEVKKQEAIATIDAQIAKAEGQLYYLENVDECTEAELADITSINDAQNSLSENLATNIQTSSNNLVTWIDNWKTAAINIGKTITGLITKFNNLFKAEKDGTGDANAGGQTGNSGGIDTTIDKNNELIDIEDRKKTLQSNIEKLRALREGLNKMSGKDLLGGINKMGSYGSGGGSKDEFEPVIEKLEKFYNYMRQLEELEAKINRLREKRNLIDASKNYYIDDLEKENNLLREQQAIYNNYVRDQGSYLAELQSQIQAQFSDWAYFNEDGVVQVKQTEFTANSEAEQERLELFLELIELYQNEYNTREENINKLYEIESTQLENIQTMYDKILSRVTDITDELNRQKDLLDHDMTMSFSNIGKFDIMDSQAGVAVEGIKNTNAYINNFKDQIKSLKAEVENGPFSELLLWDETLQSWRVNEEALQDPSVIAKYEKMGYTWRDIDTYIRSVAVKSQSINEALKETVDSANQFAEVLKQLIDDRISLIQDFFGAATDELNKIFDTFDRKMDDIDNQNNLFGIAENSLEEKYLTAVTAVAVLKQTIQILKDNKGTILETIKKDYPEFVNMINGVVVINKQAIEESTKLTEAQKADLLELYGIFEASEGQITEMEDKLVDYFNTMMEMEEAKRDAIIELKQSLHDELIARDQQEIDDLRSKYDKMSQLDNEYYNELSRRVSDARTLRDNRQQSANIGQMQAQLAVLKADNSGVYNDELINLQKQLNDALQTQADNEVTRELERIQREQQEREEDRQLTISAMENVLTFKDENSWYWQEAQRIWSEGPESVTGFLKASNEYANISDEQRAVEFENLTNSMNTAFATLQTAAGETSRVSNGIVTSEATLIRDDLDFIQSQLGEDSTLATKIDWSNSENVRELDELDGTVKGLPDTIKTNMQSLYETDIKPGVDGVVSTIQDYLGTESAIWTKLDDANKNLGTLASRSYYDDLRAIVTALTGDTENSVTTIVKTAQDAYLARTGELYNWLSDKYTTDNADKNLVETGGSSGASTKVPTTSGNGNSVSSTGGKGSGSNAASKPQLKTGSKISVKPGVRWYHDSYGGGPSGTARGGIIQHVNLQGSHPYNIEGLGWIRKQDIVGYSKGGYVDYTGIANVHGTQTEPEAFLNAKQTRLFEGLRDSLVRSSSNRAYDKKESEVAKEEYNIDNISIEVKQIADIDAVDKITRRVKEEIYKDATSNKNNMAVRRR